MSREPMGMDELVDHWTVLDDERDLVLEKRGGAQRLEFALVLKFYTRHGRFPRGRAEFSDEVVEFVARQVKVSGAEFGLYEWAGRTIERHRGQIRAHLGFRECSVADADKFTVWLTTDIASGNTVHQPVIDALALIRRYARAGNTTYYPLGEQVPEHRGTTGQWVEVVFKEDTQGRRRMVRVVFEVVTFQALREQLRCKEIWVASAGRWRDPDEDLPRDFEARRAEHYGELRKPLNPREFVDQLREEMTAELMVLDEEIGGLDWWTSPSARWARSASPPPDRRRSRGTCARSRRRWADAGRPCR
jgi:hypothetical protein